MLAALMAICLGTAGLARAQSVPSAFREGFTLSAGATFSGDYIQYGERKMLGVSGFADLDTRHNIGIEGEASFVRFRQTADVHDKVYSAGPRYHMNLGSRLQPYAKGLVGVGQFNFPYNYAHGNYLVITPGAGVDYRLNHRIRFRIVDFEYQLWPKFNYGAASNTFMSNPSVSTGIRVRIF
jgi:hypothetical protein